MSPAIAYLSWHYSMLCVFWAPLRLVHCFLLCVTWRHEKAYKHTSISRDMLYIQALLVASCTIVQSLVKISIQILCKLTTLQMFCNVKQLLNLYQIKKKGDATLYMQIVIKGAKTDSEGLFYELILPLYWAKFGYSIDCEWNNAFEWYTHPHYS